MNTMKKILFATLVTLTGCSSSMYTASTYTAPNNAFSVEVPYRSGAMRDALANQQGNNVQYVDFAYAKYYPELGFQTIEWLNNEQVQRLDIRNKEHMKTVFRGREQSSAGLIPVDNNNLHCESKNINGYNAFQCSELVKFKDSEKNYLPKPGYFSMTVIYFNQGTAVAYGYGSQETNDKLVNSIRPLGSVQ